MISNRTSQTAAGSDAAVNRTSHCYEPPAQQPHGSVLPASLEIFQNLGPLHAVATKVTHIERPHDSQNVQVASPLNSLYVPPSWCRIQPYVRTGHHFNSLSDPVFYVRKV